MVVVDASALIPLAWVGELDLLTASFDDLRTTEDVRDEVLLKRTRGAAALDSFLADITVNQRAADATEVAS
jgi:predicted nucleic acid-binding protein